MIGLIFTLDYELYGDGSGNLKDLVLEPADILLEKFAEHSAPLVIFVEAAEFELIDKYKTDADIDLIQRQIGMAYKSGHEIGLHIHPQWYRATRNNERWIVDRSEYNLCRLADERIREIVKRAISYLRNILGDPNYAPVSFRAGNWLFQPTQPAARILYECGIRIDSSIFKGGQFKEYAVDYRRLPKNRYYWRFEEDVVKENAAGKMLEIPIYSRMVPFWQMITKKRLQFEKGKESGPIHNDKWRNIKKFLRLRYPKKLDFCRMTERELKEMIEEILKEDRKSASGYKPIVAIGHTKDLIDVGSVEFLLKYLFDNRIPVNTFRQIYNRLT
ncbi:MAG: hypothetical protein HPY46_10725 [Candidatus Aminicenantes bacterium]|nr:hypothetical protein [Candidatus Aminicenantes bacterium]